MSMGYSYLYFAILIFSFLATAYVEGKVIVLLNGKASQPIYADGPSWHLKKQGTPTMGGIAFLIISIFCLALSFVYLLFFDRNNKTAISLSISLLFSVSNGLIGIFDDLTKLKRHKNAGLTPIQKLFLQFILSVLFLMARRYFMDDPTKIHILNYSIDLGFLYYPIAIFVILGIINCANLTDGIDGLAGSVALGIGISLFYISYCNFADATILSLLLIGISVGFLIYNVHPAKIFMGDTGSLYLGALAVSCAFSVNHFSLIIPLGSIYVIEGFSVILQVIYYKLTQKRLFKMAPIHHHLEKIGMSENKICLSALIVTLIASLIVNLI